MPEQIEVTLTYTRHVTFYVDADDPNDAVRRAEGALMYDGTAPDDEGLPDLDVERIKIGDREVQINADLDLWGPKTSLGLSPWKFTAYAEPEYRQVAEGYDRAEVIRAAFEAVASGDPGGSR